MGYVKSAAGPEILLGDLSSEDDQDEQAMSFPINAAYGAPRDGVSWFLQKAMSMLSKISSCQTATAFDALSVRYEDER